MKEGIHLAYDVQMIRDFVEQLKCALQVDHFELSGRNDAIHPELLELVERTSKKRGVPRMLSLFGLKKDDPELTEQEMQEAMRRFGVDMAARRDSQLRHLEALEEVLHEAMAHAEGRILDISVPASRVLDGSWFKDAEGE